MPFDEIKEELNKEQEIENRKILSLEEIYKMKAKEVPFLLDNMIVENGINAITSNSGQGKSLITLKMIEAIASGEDFLGKYKTKQTKTLIMDLEMSEDEIIRRCQSVTEKPIEGMDFYTCQGFSIDVKEDFEWLVKIIKEKEYGLIVFDTLSAIHSKDENSNSEMNKINTKLLELTNKHGATILFLHHNRKLSKGEINTQSSTRGASCIIDKASSQLIIESKDVTIVNPDKKPVKGIKLFIEQFKRRSVGILDRFAVEVCYDEESKKTGFKWAGIQEKTESAIEKAEILILNNMDGILEYSTKEIVEELKDQVGERNIITALRILVEKGTLAKGKNDDGRNEDASKRANLYSLKNDDGIDNSVTMQTSITK